MPIRSNRVLAVREILQAFCFPWQGVLLILPLGVGGVLWQEATALRPLVHSARIASVVEMPHAR